MDTVFIIFIVIIFFVVGILTIGSSQRHRFPTIPIIVIICISIFAIMWQFTHHKNIHENMDFGANATPSAISGSLQIQSPKNNKKYLILDLDETLVHSSTVRTNNIDYIIPVKTEDLGNDDVNTQNFYVIKRPGVDNFLQRVSPYYEIIIFTAGLSSYANPVLDKLNINNVISKRLYRENCTFIDGNYVKDLSILGTDLADTIIIDNNPVSYSMQPKNAIDCTSFINNPYDVELWHIGDFLVGNASAVDVRDICQNWREWCRTHKSTAPKTQETEYLL